MLCHQCRRIAAAIIQRGPTSLPQHARLMHTPSASQFRIGALLQPAFGSSVRAQRIVRRSYSASTPSTSSTDTPSIPEKPDYLDNDETVIWDKLMAEFTPTELTVQDISGGCGSMYAIEIASEKFKGLNMLKQQRMVNAVLGDQMKGWHGVQLRTKIP